MKNTVVTNNTITSLHTDNVITSRHLPVKHKKNAIAFLSKVAKNRKTDAPSTSFLRRNVRDYINSIRFGEQELTPEFMDRCFFVYNMLKSIEKTSKMTKDELKEHMHKLQEEMLLEDLING